MVRQSKLFSQSIIYLITEGINKAIPFFILPLISYYITPDDYGVLTNYNVLAQVFAVLCYSITCVIIPVMYVKLNTDEFKIFVSNVIILNTFVTLFLLVILFIFYRIIENGTGLAFFYQILALISTFFASFGQVNLTIWRSEEKAIYFGSYHISQTLIDIGVSVFLIMVLFWGWRGRVYAMSLASIILGIFSIMLLAKRGFICLRVSKKYLVMIFGFALPLLPHGLSFWLKSGADKLLLTNMCGLDINGLYSVAMTFGAIVSIIVTAFNNAFGPYLFKRLHILDSYEESVSRAEGKKKIVILFRRLILLLLLFVILSYLISYFFIDLVYQESYKPSVVYLPLIFLGQLFMGVYSLFVNFIHYTQNTKALGVITFSLTGLQVLLSYILILKMGAVGAALSSAIISFFIMVLVSIYAAHVYKMPWNYLIQNK